MAKVVVAMSGGVDSSLAAALMKEAGHEVIGIMLKLWAEEGCRSNRCCTPESVEDAELIADQLSIPFFVLDYKQNFKQQVVDPFAQGYAEALTPNPCILCNQKIRFGRLLEEAMKLGAEKLITGHYAIVREERGRFRLFRGVDAGKDQSYVLYRLNQNQLSHVAFPLGEMTKVQCREMASERGLSSADRPDSQDLCFVGDGDYRDFLRRQGGRSLPGNMVDPQGNIVGRHQGLDHYTVGQRRGLGLSLPEPYYVLALEGEPNRLIVGPQPYRGQKEIFVQGMHYIADPSPLSPIEVQVKIRYTSSSRPAILIPLQNQRAAVTFTQSVFYPAPGQSLVCYQGDEVLGGGFIEKQVWTHSQ